VTVAFPGHEVGPASSRLSAGRQTDLAVAGGTGQQLARTRGGETEEILHVLVPHFALACRQLADQPD